MKVKIKNVRPNPFRSVRVDQSRVNELVRSIRKTGFWENLVGRTTANGKVELAYGHHRLKALRKIYGENAQIEIKIQKLSDAEMLQIMAHENDAVYSHTSDTVLESVQAVIKAYGSGDIELRDPSAKATEIKYAPSYSNTYRDQSRPYTSGTVAEFLGWQQNLAATAINLLGAIDDKLITREELVGLSNARLQELSAQLSRARRIAKSVDDQSIVKKTVKKTAKALQDRESIRSVRSIARKVASAHATRPDIDEFARMLVRDVNNCLRHRHERALKEIIKYQKFLTKAKRDALFDSLSDLADRAVEFANQITE